MAKVTRTYEEDPERCKATTRLGQCINKAQEGMDYCPRHTKKRPPDTEMKNYLITRTYLKDGFERHSAIDEIRGLREEIAIARAMIEKRLSIVDSKADYLHACGQVNTLLLTVDKLINSFHRLDVNLGNMLSKSALLEVAKEVVQILTEELKHVEGYEAIIDRVLSKISESVSTQEQR